MEYRTSFRSFLGTLVYNLSPIATAGVTLYFIGSSAHFLIWAASGLMALFSLHRVLGSIFVYLNKLYLDETGIITSGVFSRTAMRWAEVTSAVLRERNNVVSRTDRMLVFESGHRMLSYVISTLSRQNEKEVLDMVNKKTKLVKYHDKPTI